MRFQYFVLQFDSLKTAVFGSVSPNRTAVYVWFRFCHLFCFSALSVPLTHFKNDKVLVSFICLGLLTPIIYNHCGLFVKLSFIDQSLVSVFAIFCTDGVKIDLKDGFIKHRGSRQIWFHKKNVGPVRSVLKKAEPKFWLPHTTTV